VFCFLIVVSAQYAFHVHVTAQAQSGNVIVI